jgi:[ribosomal protein S5]-alanine N-acetyltransferase
MKFGQKKIESPYSDNNTVQKNLETPRLSLRALHHTNAAFILELLNTPQWLKFIGDKNVRSIEGAGVYIQNIKDQPAVMYWVVYLKTEQIPVGIVTFYKRKYLDHHDIGFAMLPTYYKHGYAFEATQGVLDYISETHEHSQIKAIVMPENHSSIALLNKLGMTFEKEIKVKEQPLKLYAKSYS